MQFLGKVVDIPVVVQHQVSMVQVVLKTVGHDESLEHQTLGSKRQE